MLGNYYIQRNLKAMGYYNGAIDGIIGKLSKQGIKDFQRDYGLVIDGIYGKNTNAVMFKVVSKMQSILGVTPDGLWGDITENAYKSFNNIKYFKLKDFKCHCGCGEYRIDIRLVKILDEIRKFYNKPLFPTSRVRCDKHNNSIKNASKTSWHKVSRGGKACDFYVQGVKVTELLSHCIDLRNRGKIRYTYTNADNMNGVVHIDIGGII